MNPDEVGGYRVLRKLGDGARAEVLLGHPSGDDPDSTPAALKRYRREITDESVFGEIEALQRAAGPHVVEVIDVATCADGARLLILERLGGITLARLLADRGALSPGEAITVLAPIGAALSRLHRAGVVHGAVGAEAVLFDSAGAPVLARFGRASLITPGLPVAALELELGVLADRLAFSALVERLLPAALPDSASLDPEQLGERLFDLADAQPVDLSRSGDTEQQAVAARLFTGSPVPEPGGGGNDGRGRRAAAFLAALGAPEWTDDLVVRVSAILARLRASLAQVRARMWVVAGGVLVALVTAAFVVPSAPAGSPDSGPSATPGAPSGVPSGDTREVAAPGSIGGDDPVAAAAALLAARQGCIRDLSVLCLDGVGQPGSAALANDTALVRDIQSGGEIPPFPASISLTLVERLGDSAIVSLDPSDTATQTTPASLLLMKGEAGWRIRDYLSR